MNTIEESFGKYFPRLNVHLPEGAVDSMEGGILRDGPTQITYSFGNDENGKYMAIYASNTFFWGGYHVKFRENGQVEELPVLRDFTMHRSNETTEERRKIKEEQNNHNEMVYAMMKKEGILAIEDRECMKALEDFK